MVRSVREHLKLPASMDHRSLINDHVARVEVRSEELVIQLVPPAGSDRANTEVDSTLKVPWQKTGANQYQCAWRSASTVVIPAMTEPAIAIAAGIPSGNSRLITAATNIAATGRAITK